MIGKLITAESRRVFTEGARLINDAKRSGAITVTDAAKLLVTLFGMV